MLYHLQKFSRHSLILAGVFLAFQLKAQQTQVSLPITFDNPSVNYAVVDFGGNESIIENDPANPTNKVLKIIKTSSAEGWAGTTLSTEAGLASSIPFVQGATSLRLRMFAPNVNMQIRLKVEDAADPTRSVETPAYTTTADGWHILTFNFANQAPGTAPINFSFTYNKLSVFCNFGINGATAGAKTFYIDDVEFGAGPSSGKLKIDLPITWDDTASVDYSTTDFGGNESELSADPLNASNIVLKLTRTAQSISFAGTVLSTEFGLLNAIPLTAVNRFITAKVYSPVANIPIRLKVENINGGINAETDQIVTVANQWQLLTYDFAQHAAGTPPINYNNVHNKLVIFFNFGALGPQTGTQVFYLDDVYFGTVTDLPPTIDVNAVALYPNPCHNFVNISGLKEGEGKFSLFNAQGKRCHVPVSAIQGGNFQLSVSHLPQGIYRLMVQQGEKTTSHNLIVK